MRTRLKFLFAILAFSIATYPRSHSEDHWESYQPRTLKSIVDAHNLSELEQVKGVPTKKNAMYISADSLPSRTPLIYLGQFRPLPAKSAVLLTAWRKTLGGQAPPPDVFSTEIHFKEGADEYWIAVQQPLVPDVRKELKTGQEIDGYIIVIGAIKMGRSWEWLFAMNRFDS